MPLTATDWIVIVGYLLVNLVISIYYRRRSSGNTEEFFVSGRDVSWWLAGTSMVATTFAADTPLAVTGIVAGWSRWLELRLDPVANRTEWRIAHWLWPVCFVLVGLMLLNYREA